MRKCREKVERPNFFTKATLVKTIRVENKHETKKNEMGYTQKKTKQPKVDSSLGKFQGNSLRDIRVRAGIR